MPNKWDKYVVEEGVPLAAPPKAPTTGAAGWEAYRVHPETGQPEKIPSGAGISFKETILGAMTRPEDIGGAIGEFVGAPFGPKGMAAGAGLGGMAGRMAEMLPPGWEQGYQPDPLVPLQAQLEEADFIGKRITTDDKLPDPTHTEILTELGMAGLRQAAMARVGAAIPALVTKGIVEPTRKFIMGPLHREVKTATKTLGPYMKKKLLPLLPAEATDGWLSLK
jgi:hypothetical protein